MSTLLPVDLLFASDEEQIILRTLQKRPDSTLSALATRTAIPFARLEQILTGMVQQSHIVERLREGERTFAVRFTRSRKQVRNMPTGVLELFTQPADAFLADVPLAAALPRPERQALLDLSVSRPILPDEVCVWQGAPAEHVGLVQNGLLKRSRLQGGAAKVTVGAGAAYVRRGEWFNVSEALGHFPSSATLTAVTDGELLLWPVDAFVDFARAHSRFAVALCRWLTRRWHRCEESKQRDGARFWVLEAVEAGAGTTTLAANLGLVARKNGGETPARVLLWDATGAGNGLLRALRGRATRPTAPTPDGVTLASCRGLDVLLKLETGDYPLQVQVDMLLARFQKQYDVIICDTGTATTELVWRLRGQAQTLLTVTADPAGAEAGMARWQQQITPRPGQKRFLALNQTDLNGNDLDHGFNLLIPNATTALHAASRQNKPLVQAAPEAPFTHALREIHRRLSLTHTIGIFIPSTLDVAVSVDNGAQVQAALAFLGNVFGGATSSDARGVWQSEDSGLVAEQVTVVRTFVSRRDLERNLDNVIRFAMTLKHEMRQEAVAVDVDSELVLV